MNDAERERTATDAFARAFGGRPSFAVRAPGRVNLIGEHTDYNHGLVLPCAIDLDTVIWATPRSDQKIRAISLELGAQAEFEFELPAVQDGADATALKMRRGSGRWIDYLAGPIFALAQTGRPLPKLRGFDAVISSRIPIGAGLSSSAALGLAATWTLARANDLVLDSDAGLHRRSLAELAWCGERDYVGTQCGVLDFYASALGRTGKALRIDCLDRTIREIEIPDAVEILVAHSGVTRSVAASRYAERVAECARAVDQARQAGMCGAEATSLRALTGVDLKELASHLDRVAFLRARHVIEENTRVEQFAEAIEAQRFEDAGTTLQQGMESLRSNYEASSPELDLLCEAGDEAEGCYGSRLTGAGWGGCSIHLIEAGSGPDVSAQIEARFNEGFGRSPPTWSVRACQGAGAWLSTVSDSNVKRR